MSLYNTRFLTTYLISFSLIESLIAMLIQLGGKKFLKVIILNLKEGKKEAMWTNWKISSKIQLRRM